jgi:Rad3-related DNA helicase
MQLDGFDYAFRFPGLLRVKQSAGRVIRGEQDRGVVVLLERRFQQTDFARQLPQHWHPEYCQDLDSLQQSLRLFWERTDGTD